MSTRKSTAIEFAVAYLFILFSCYVALFQFDWLRDNVLPTIISHPCGIPASVSSSSGTNSNTNSNNNHHNVNAANKSLTQPAPSMLDSFKISPSQQRWVEDLLFLHLPASYGAPRPDADYYIWAGTFVTWFTYWTVAGIFFLFDFTLSGDTNNEPRRDEAKNWRSLRHNYQPHFTTPKTPEWDKYTQAIHWALKCSFASFPVLVIYPAIARRWRWEQMCGPASAEEPFHLLLLRLTVVFFLTDLLFYSLHRLAHVPSLYGRLHKNHHIFTATYAVNAVACDVAEHHLVNLPTVHLACILAGVGPVGWCLWSAIAGINTTISHSGYNVFYVGGHDEAHDAHHALQKCEYGIDTWMDALLRTTKSDYMRELRKKKLARVA